MAGVAATVTAWDLPTRLFKWSLVILIVVAWISSGFDDPAMTVHKAAGYGILTLVIYRILWGFFGSSTARFSRFLRSPSTVLAYLKAVRAKTDRPYLGHNPAGGLMVIGLLAVCAIQAGLGLIASDGVLAAGPLADIVGPRLSSIAAKVHSIWFYAILGLALVHIAVNLFHQFVIRDDLIGAMVTGRKKADAYVDGGSIVRGSPATALSCLVIAAALVFIVAVLPSSPLFSAPSP